MFSECKWPISYTLSQKPSPATAISIHRPKCKRQEARTRVALEILIENVLKDIPVTERLPIPARRQYGAHTGSASGDDPVHVRDAGRVYRWDTGNCNQRD